MDFYKILKGGVGVGMNNFDRLFAEKYGGGAWQLTTLTSALPLSFKSKGKALTDYKIYGTSDGAGVETESGEPTGYKLPMTVTSEEETENLWDEEYHGILASGTVTYNPIYVGEGEFTLSTTAPRTTSSAANLFFLAGSVSTGASTVNSGVWNTQSRTVTAIDGYVTIGYRAYDSVDPRNYQTMLNAGSTALPYIPHRYSTTTPIYIGDTKLGAEEYVDYESGKIYRTVDGVLTPTDPPVVLPELSTYSGNNTLSCSETLREVSITGYIKGV